MRPSSMLLVLPATAMALVTPKPDIVARALYPRQSATCTYTCPPTDEMEVKLTNSFTMGNLFCFYGQEDCEYSTSTGLLLTNPAGECPPNAVGTPSSCNPGRRRAYRREDNFTAMMRRKNAIEEAQERVKRRRESTNGAVMKSASAEEVVARAVQEDVAALDARREETTANEALA